MREIRRQVTRENRGISLYAPPESLHYVHVSAETFAAALRWKFGGEFNRWKPGTNALDANT
jgi:hypothetical protein